MAIDRFGRNINYLRISLTDHCNLRCRYCMPEEGVFLQTAQMMNDEEVLRIIELFSTLGFDKIRLTGGEPTVRNGIVGLVRNIAAIPRIQHVTMTTNGVLFSRYARPLAEAGLKRVNFSLDTLDIDKYREITGRNALNLVLEGIQAAEVAGLTPIKINVVVMRNYNIDDVCALAGLTWQNNYQVRFIEMMPIGSSSELQAREFVPAGEIRQILETQLGGLLCLTPGNLDGEARLYSFSRAKGQIGFISSISESFCYACNRVRITSDGRLRLCLLRENELDLLALLRAGANQDELRQQVIEAIWQKPWGNALREGQIPTGKQMHAIGG